MKLIVELIFLCLVLSSPVGAEEEARKGYLEIHFFEGEYDELGGASDPSDVGEKGVGFTLGKQVLPNYRQKLSPAFGRYLGDLFTFASAEIHGDAFGDDNERIYGYEILEDVPHYVAHIGEAVVVGIEMNKEMAERLAYNIGLAGRLYHVHDAQVAYSSNDDSYYFAPDDRFEIGSSFRAGLEYALSKEGGTNLSLDFERSFMGDIEDHSRYSVGIVWRQ